MTSRLRIAVVVVACAAACALATGAAGADTEPAAHGAEHGPSAPPQPINWWHGILGEKKGVEPGLFWRAPGEPAPFAASLFNFALLVLAFVYLGKKPLAAALVKRKQNIMREMDEARRLREEAETRLAQYEAKLGRLSEELETLRAEYRGHGERDKERIVREAKERSQKMRADAEQILDQDLKQMRRDLLAETVENAAKLANRLIAEKSTSADHDRFAETFLKDLKVRYTASRGVGRGGAA